MYKIFKIDGKDYKVEYTIEAALYEECTEAVMNFMVDSSTAADAKDMKMLIKNMSNVPQITLTLFYAGLLEHHSPSSGDGSVANLADAKRLSTQYFRENPDVEDANFYGLLNTLIGQMREDGFFKQIGLEQMMTSSTSDIKKPQDHKKKITKITAD